MDIYHLWFDLRPGQRDVELADRITGYLGRLVDDGRIVSFRLSRRKLGLGPADLGEFHVMIEVRDLAQLDEAFTAVSKRSGVVESLHAGVNQMVVNFKAALYRDFPDAHRERGEERF